MSGTTPPNAGGPVGEARPVREAGPVRVYGWSWGPDEARRPQLPWIGIFLVIFGALLLLDRLTPEFRSAGNLLVLAAGLAFLVVWALRRGTFALYAGAFLTAATVPGLLTAYGYAAGPGVGTVAYGVAFLFVAAVRYARGGGYGWQALFGLILLAVGLPEVALPEVASVVLPGLLVVLGIMLLVRGAANRR